MKVLFGVLIGLLLLIAPAPARVSTGSRRSRTRSATSRPVPEGPYAVR